MNFFSGNCHVLGCSVSRGGKRNFLVARENLFIHVQLIRFNLRIRCNLWKTTNVLSL